MTAHFPHAFILPTEGRTIPPVGPPPARHAARSALWLGLGYFIAASVSLLSTRFDGDIAYCWIATALLLARLAHLPPRHWPTPLAACAVASCLASALFGAGLRAAMPFAFVLAGEAAIGALLLRRFIPDGRYFDNIPNVVRYVLLVGGAMPLLSAFGGATVSGIAFGTTYWAAWGAWYTVHALGALTYTPIVVLLMDDPGRRRLADFDPRRGGGGNLALAAAMVLVVGVTFGQTRLPLFFLPLMPLTLLTLRAGRFGAALGICIVAVGGGALTVAGFGPATLASSDPAMRGMFFQLYLATTVVTMLPLAAELNRRKALTRQLADSEAMFRLMADRSGDILFNLDVEGRVRYCSSSIMRFGGFDAAAMLGQNALKMIVEDDRIVVAAIHGRALARPEETFVYEYRALTGQGDTWFESHTRATVDGDGIVTGVVSAARDISHRKRSEAKLVDAANSDALTGLANRRRFDERLRHAMRAPSRAGDAGCLAIVDIDFFKRVNDSHGHAAGDAVLQGVAARLQPSLRADDLVARIGGEEFGLVLWGLQPAEAGGLCDRLRQAIAADPIIAGTAAIAVTVSIGVAALADHPALPALFAAADAALYRAKAEGRNCIRLAA